MGLSRSDCCIGIHCLCLFKFAKLLTLKKGYTLATPDDLPAVQSAVSHPPTSFANHFSLSGLVSMHELFAHGAAVVSRIVG